ncbi:MAG: hypothetical protein A3A33_00920 [Candidatus Yanofskybacteria bacterium RIFCSPLOWO2_01_FULL_49_25]|uniref:Pyruvate phosphate dikinase AMP/ATP-binding domain-containing protein n=1 Tax=Candidatus Yanofskybacteria bacterium RIFCSPLOWO2_01_FULL_49_25 TaxID=1802701 RepID=A0A1F8GWN2_9BACT|nr:MAG: hypothetical protein A3A33_00920 [Candidatus Yanofskybacteria bacterium RIFCSPLOWO2_01_FULL_49_25]
MKSTLIASLSDLRQTDARRIGNKAAMLGELMQRKMNVPNGFIILQKANRQEILEAFDDLGSSRVAVRSSAPGEDGMKKSHAGQFMTVLNVRRPTLMSAIKKVRVSGPRMSVIVQTMIQPTYAGVAFSKNPVTNNKNEIIIEAVRGLGESLVSGKKTPRRYIVSGGNHTGTPLWIARLATLTKKLEKQFGYPVDIEWALAKNQLYILQLRPVTT